MFYFLSFFFIANDSILLTFNEGGTVESIEETSSGLKEIGFIQLMKENVILKKKELKEKKKIKIK